MHDLPRLGTFIRPVGGFAYCICVDYTDGVRRVQGQRHGLKNKRVFDDGYRDLAGSSFDLVPVRPGVWKSPHVWAGSPRYWVEIAGGTTGQLDLFGGAHG